MENNVSCSNGLSCSTNGKSAMDKFNTAYDIVIPALAAIVAFAPYLRKFVTDIHSVYVKAKANA
ncbi:MAG: hypothetical protein LUD27_06635 [Clostridia bacterium]|nr:hypothetical protein [Clostridia bacterium]